MSELDKFFKFKIGEIVAIKQSNIVHKRDWSLKDPWVCVPLKAIVILRILDECTGGIQAHYDIRTMNRELAVPGDLRKLNEIELCKPEEWKTLYPEFLVQEKIDRTIK